METQIPVEIVDIVEKQRRQSILFSEDLSFKRRSNFRNDLLRLTWDKWRMNWKLASQPDNRIAQAIAATEASKSREPINVSVSMNFEKASDSSIQGVVIDKYQSIDINIDSASPRHLDNLLWRIEGYKRGVIPISLQSGDSVVKQFIFRTRSWLFFTPLAHMLQIQVRYTVDDRDHLYTVPFNLQIQADITAVMIGAVVGGAIGGIARLLNSLQLNEISALGADAGFFSVLLAVILSAILVVSFARKSGTQQIISVEDFWGGLFLGFLVGFLGQDFALNLIVPSADK